jgi:hypothetical protein
LTFFLISNRSSITSSSFRLGWTRLYISISREEDQ